MQLAVYGQDDEAQDFWLLCKVDDTARSTRVKYIIRLFGLLLFSRILTGDGTAGWCGLWRTVCCRFWLERKILIMIMQKADSERREKKRIYWWIYWWTCISKFPRSITFWTVCFQHSGKMMICSIFYVLYNIHYFIIWIHHTFPHTTFLLLSWKGFSRSLFNLILIKYEIMHAGYCL